MKEFKFIPNVYSYKPKNTFIAVLPSGIKTKKELLKQLAIVLELPDYFGFNWDALNDCLCDLHWIEEKVVVLMHEDIPLVGTVDAKIYLQVLIDAVNNWKEGEEHTLDIVFPEQLKVGIATSLRSTI